MRALEDDRYVRQTEGYLPKANVAFVDEIFKANSAILNTLLTVLNERLFDNGTKRELVPLLCLVKLCTPACTHCHCIPFPVHLSDALARAYLLRIVTSNTRCFVIHLVNALSSTCLSSTLYSSSILSAVLASCCRLARPMSSQKAKNLMPYMTDF